MKNREHFSKLPSVKLGVCKQGLIFYISRNYYNFSQAKRDIMDQTFEKAGGIYATALKKFMTTSETAVKICIDENIASVTTLYSVMRRYYECFPLYKFFK